MHQQRVILRIQNRLQDSAHNTLRDIGLFRALHSNAHMVDAAGVHKALVSLWVLLVHQSTGLY